MKAAIEPVRTWIREMISLVDIRMMTAESSPFFQRLMADCSELLTVLQAFDSCRQSTLSAEYFSRMIEKSEAIMMILTILYRMGRISEMQYANIKAQGIEVQSQIHKAAKNGI